MSEDLARQLRLTTSRAAYRRAGLVIGSAAAPTLLTPEEFDELGHERQAKLFADPVIEIAASDDGITFKRIPAEIRAEAIERYQEFMTGTGDEGGALSQAQLEPNSASDAAAATGDDASQAATEAVTLSSGEKQPAADAAPAPVAASVSPAVEGVKAPRPSAGKPSGRKSKAATNAQTSEAKAAS